MPSQNRRIMITLQDRAVFDALGLDPDRGGAREVWAALDRYAELVIQAGSELKLDRRQWNYLAEVLHGLLEFDDFSLNPAYSRAILIGQIRDAQQLNAAADRIFGRGKGDLAASDLADKIGRLDTAGCEAVLVAVKWFWTHADDIDHNAEEWWTPAFRQACAAARIETTNA